MIKLLNAGQLASIPSAPVRFESRINGDQLAWFYGVNYSPYLFEVLDDSGLVRGVLPPGEKVIPLQVRSEYLVLNPVATILSTPVVPASAWAVYVDVAEQEPEVAMLLGTVPSEAASVSTTGGAIAGQAGLEAAASEGYLWNGASWVPASSASAANLVAQSGAGVQLSAPPGEWTVPSNLGVGNGASAVRAAGGAGVRHVARRVGFGISSKVAIAATTLTVVLRDGASGAGTIVDSWVFDLPAAIVSPPIVIREEISLAGSPATAMALEFTAGLANLNCYCTLSGYDAS